MSNATKCLAGAALSAVLIASAASQPSAETLFKIVT